MPICSHCKVDDGEPVNRLRGTDRWFHEHCWDAITASLERKGIIKARGKRRAQNVWVCTDPGEAVN
jgi:hypothetical protein